MWKYKKDIKKVFEIISPLVINPNKKSITISISKRFLLFNLLNRVIDYIENDPHLNFISLLKNYKVLGNFMDGTIRELYRDRNKSYFKNFFIDKELYNHIKEDIERAYSINKDIRLTITKRGVIVYDNYNPEEFNILLLTAHSGTWLPENISKKQNLSKRLRISIEDTDIHKIYGRIVLEKSGIWIDNKMSRFACDYNRSLDKAIYKNNSESWIKKLWKEELTNKEREWLIKGHQEFYFTIKQVVDSFRFNIIFDGHSMRDMPDRPSISFGTRFIPKFYMPIVRAMQNKLIEIGYNDIALNKPFSGGYILKWLHEQFPNRFIFSMEINKRLYMDKFGVRTNMRKLKRLSDDIFDYIFDVS